MTAARAGADRVSLGVDFGATGVRALFAGSGQQVRRLDLPADGPPWLGCAPAGSGVLPVTFPSLKSLVAGGRSVPWRGQSVDVDTVVVRLFRALRKRVEEQADALVAQTVVSVPASFQSAQRQALRDAASEAGLTPVRLISDSTFCICWASSLLADCTRTSPPSLAAAATNMSRSACQRASLSVSSERPISTRPSSREAPGTTPPPPRARTRPMMMLRTRETTTSAVRSVMSRGISP